MDDRWSTLPAWEGEIPHNAQVVVIAAPGGGKSTLAASMTLDVGSLVAIDAKARLALPSSRVVELPPWEPPPPGTRPDRWQGGDAFDRALRSALSWRDPARHGRLANRIVLRPSVTDLEGFEAHDAIFRALYLRGAALVWIDEITATGATPGRTQPWLRGISARGRTRDLGLWTLSQRPYAMMPTILRANAEFMLMGSVDPDDLRDFRRPGGEIATAIPRRTGRFLLWQSGTVEPFRLYVPIPPELRRWEAP